VFQRFGQAKFSNDFFGVKLQPFLCMAIAVSKNNAQFKSAKNQLKNNHLAI